MEHAFDHRLAFVVDRHCRDARRDPTRHQCSEWNRLHGQFDTVGDQLVDVGVERLSGAVVLDQHR
jgi:hypothetical protein